MYPRSVLHIIGTGPNKEKLETLIEQLELHHSVFLRGVMANEQIAEELSKNPYLLFGKPNCPDGDLEGIPNVLKEAMPSGVPVVSTQHAGIPELIEHGVSGCLVPERDPAALAKCIQFLLEHPEKWEQLSLNARKSLKGVST